jgi:hypothetical protein
MGKLEHVFDNSQRPTAKQVRPGWIDPTTLEVLRGGEG